MAFIPLCLSSHYYDSVLMSIIGLIGKVPCAQGVRLVYYNSRANLLLLEIGDIPHSYQPTYLGTACLPQHGLLLGCNTSYFCDDEVCSSSMLARCQAGLCAT